MRLRALGCPSTTAELGAIAGVAIAGVAAGDVMAVATGVAAPTAAAAVAVGAAAVAAVGAAVVETSADVANDDEEASAAERLTPTCLVSVTNALINAFRNGPINFGILWDEDANSISAFDRIGNDASSGSINAKLSSQFSGVISCSAARCSAIVAISIVDAHRASFITPIQNTSLDPLGPVGHPVLDESSDGTSGVVAVAVDAVGTTEDVDAIAGCNLDELDADADDLKEAELAGVDTGKIRYRLVGSV